MAGTDSTGSLNFEQLEYILSKLEQCTNDYLYFFDLKKDYFRISPAALEFFDLPEYKFNNACENILKVVFPNDRDALIENLNQIKNGTSNTHDMEYRWVDKSGNLIWISCRGIVVVDSVDSLVIAGRINKLGNKNIADNITELLSMEKLKTDYSQFQLNHKKSSLFMKIGIDNFKMINARHGYKTGDFILKEIARCICSCINDNTNIYRLSGDEFAIWMKDAADESCGKDLYYKIRDLIDKRIEKNNYTVMYTVSAGIYISKPEDDINDIQTRLDFALKGAKSNGKNCFSIYKEANYEEYLKKFEIQELLRESINNNFDGFDVYYQPLIDCQSEQLIGAEALLRWNCKKYGSLSPAIIIPILEESNLIIPVGKWVTKTALQQCKEWQKYIPDFKININLSYVQIRRSNIEKYIISIVEESGIKPSCITFELTESIHIENDFTVQRLMKTFKNSGLKLALDDFGTGYSNFTYISNIDVNYIKLDRSFMSKAFSNPYYYALVENMVKMAHDLNLIVCAEGIETEKEMEDAKRLSSDILQGYFYGKPVNCNEFFCSNIKPLI